MTRQEFLKCCAAMGIGTLLAPTLLTSCKKEDDPLQVNFTGKVLVIGAGSAGLMAGYLLKRHNIDFQILEASSVYGGRVKKTTTFADFPIDIGAEWVHDSPSVFATLIDDDSVNGSIDLIPYNPDTVYTWNGSSLTRLNLGTAFYGELKFKHSTWYDFFEQYIVPGIADKILYNSPVTAIDYTSDKILVTTSSGTLEADKVLVTVPTTILQSNAITFTPALPQSKANALDSMSMPDGIKVFMEFSEKFYPDVLTFNAGTGGSSDEKIFYDAAFKKNTSRNVLGLFTIGTPASAYTNLSTEAEIIEKVLGELDTIFDGKATQTYQKHIIQNWSAEPYIQGSYTFFEGSESSLQDTIREPLDSKVYFAGESLHANASATVHGAGQSGMEVTRTILQG